MWRNLPPLRTWQPFKKLGHSHPDSPVLAGCLPVKVQRSALLISFELECCAGGWKVVTKLPARCPVLSKLAPQQGAPGSVFMWVQECDFSLLLLQALLQAEKCCMPEGVSLFALCRRQSFSSQRACNSFSLRGSHAEGRGGETALPLLEGHPHQDSTYSRSLKRQNQMVVVS